MAENSKKPRIRFKGFTEEWEQRKLGETVQITMGQSPDGATYLNSPSDFILVQGNADLVNGWVYPRVWTTQKTKICNAGDLIMSVRAPAGAMGKTSYNAVIGRGVAAIKGNEFIFQQLTKMDSEGFWKKDSSGSTFESLNSEAIKNAEIKIPKHIEQEKIGNLFYNLDSLIALHQRKYDKLLNVKKALLDKMFPKNGKNIPEIRFKGFTEAWEQRKYEDLGSNISGGSLSYDDLDENGVNKCVLYGELYTHYDCIIKNIQYRTNKQGCTIYRNDILFPQSTTVDAFSLISPACLNEEKAETGGVFIIRPNKNVDGNFVAYYTKGNTNQRIKLSKKAQGLTIVHLYYQSIKDETIFIPKIEEQNKISNLFNSLDSLIALHQRECEKLKNVKKSLLEKMFV